MSHTIQPDNQSYCVFLRGVNVKGTNMKMKDVCAVFEKAGVHKVTSVLASGNIIFQSTKSAIELKPILEDAMSSHFNYEAFLFIKNKNEIETIISNNPFETEANFHVYGFIGVEGIGDLLIESFKKIEPLSGEEAQYFQNNFYWKVSKGNTLESNFGKILGKKNLKAEFTSRNMNTLEKILEKI